MFGLHHLWILSFIFQGFLQFQTESLRCYVGLGNTSTRNKQELVQCPAKKYYVCVKMYGGGMGDQIQRYCEKIKREEYNELLDIEEKLQNNEEYSSSLASDPTCKPSKHNGRDVIICLCSMDKCNKAPSMMMRVGYQPIIFLLLYAIVSSFIDITVL